jgi:uncharacterized membrane protein
MFVLGSIVVLAGIALILLGVIAAARKVFLEEGKGFAAGEKSYFDFEGLAKVISAILTAPSWLLMVAAGMALVYLGHQIAVGGWPFA